MRVIAFIPARSGSKSIKLKNIKNFCGKPLIYWALKALEETKEIRQVYIAVDDSITKKIVNSFNLSKSIIYKRNPKNATDTSSTESVMLEFLSKNRFDKKDIFILVQATCPFVRSIDFTKALNQYRKLGADSLLSCVRLKRFFWDDKGTALNYDFKNRPRRQDFKGTFLENGSFYINTVGNILMHKNRLCGKVSIYEMNDYAGIELDEDFDWIVAENLFKKNNPQFYRPVKKVKLFLTDVDGVLTDGGMYYNNKKDEFKKFNTRDGMGIELLRKSGIKVGILTSENTEIVARRAKKLRVDFLFQGVKNKAETAKQICRKINISLNEVAYIGDDLNDAGLLNIAGLSACPADGAEAIKSLSNIITLNSYGGKGAVREFAQIILKARLS